MANQEHLDILKQGTKVWNLWRAAHPDIIPILWQTNLNKFYLRGANLSEAVRLLTAESVTHKESCLNSDMRIERPASRSGTSWGATPADKDPDLRARRRKGSESCAPC